MTWIRAIGTSLVDTVDRYPTDWYFVYVDSASPHPFRRFLKPGFQHVIALKRDGRVWLMVDSTLSFAEISIVRSDATPWQLFPGATIDYVQVLREAKAKFQWHFLPITCVDVCKYLIGVSAWWVKTPWQFHRYVRRYGTQSTERQT